MAIIYHQMYTHTASAFGLEHSIGLDVWTQFTGHLLSSISGENLRVNLCDVNLTDPIL